MIERYFLDGRHAMEKKGWCGRQCAGLRTAAAAAGEGDREWERVSRTTPSSSCSTTNLDS